MRQKTYFVTDAHLGSGADSRQREQDLVRWLETIEPEAKRVIMLGDIFDFWFTYKYVVPRGHVRLLGKMAEMADKGVKFHFFIGIFGQKTRLSGSQECRFDLRLFQKSTAGTMR